MPCSAFVCYSHKDETYLLELKKYLKPHVRGSSIVVWDDTRIRPGDEGRKEIKAELESAPLAILLVSPDFLDSDFIAEEELPHILDSAKSSGLRVLWIALRPSAYKTTEIEKYQALNNPLRPLSKLEGNSLAASS